MSLSSSVNKIYSQILIKNPFTPIIIHVALLDQAFAHCPIFLTAGKKPGPYLSPSVANHPLKLAKDHRLGRLLPHQQPNLS
tara:strand:- start:265 stop:507 length:243 start_codon:yes stop_codon:yes gene_type:complete